MIPGFILASAFALLLADCVLAVLRSDTDTIALRGLIDATRTRPPEGYDRIASERRAGHGKAAEFAGIAQRSAFNVTCACMARG